MRAPLLLAILPFALDPCSGSKSSKPAGELDRPSDGIVVTGAELAGLLGAAPDSIAAFRWSDLDGWRAVPVQIDERAVVAWPDVFDGVPSPWPVPLEPDELVLAWCDPATFVGPDPDPAFDADDELALSAADAGERAPVDTPFPAGALAAGASELMLFDPVDGGLGWLYLVRHDGSLDPTAGEDRVHYAFELASGLSYSDGYEILGGPNPEVSTAESPGVWRLAFSDRWIMDGLWIADGAPGTVDLLDRHRTSTDPPKCARNEDTFCGYGVDVVFGAFLANIDGPVRAIRSVAGANSGVLSQRDVVLWPRRIDIASFVRVHPISPVEDVLDLSDAALGMRYIAPWVPKGIVLDGDPTADPVPPAKKPTWEVVTGALGTFVVSFAIVSDQPGLVIRGAFADDLAPSPLPCTGDTHAIGAFGVRFDDEIENTDPRLVDEFGVLRTLITARAIYVEPTASPDGLSASEAEAKGKLRHAQHEAPIEVTVAPFGPAAPIAAPPPPPAEPLRIAAGAGGRVAFALRLPGSSALRWRVAEGELPRGLFLDPAGVLRGRVLKTGPRRLVLRADNAAGAVDVEVILPPAPAFLGRDLADWIEKTRRLVRALFGRS